MLIKKTSGSMLLRWIYTFIFFIFSVKESNAFLEPGSWITEAELDTALLFSKSSYKDTSINVTMTCKKDASYIFSWKLLTSECDEAFWNINSTMKTSDISDFAIVESVEIDNIDREIDCKADKSIQLINKSTVTDGSQLLVLLLKCAKARECPNENKLTLTVKFVSDYGYLSAIEYPLRTFYGLLALAYLSLGILWLVFICCHLKDLLRIQYYITVVIIMGAVEQITFYALYKTLNSTGNVVYSAVIFSEIISCTKRTLARFLVMIACVGYGITKSRLGTAYKRMLAICIIYFLFSATESGLRATNSSFKHSKMVLVVGIPVVIIDLCIVWWSLSNLLSTLRETRLRRNVVKHRLYRIFSNLLISVSVVSLLCMILSTFFLHWRSCTHVWSYIWIDQTFWQILFFTILFTIVILWRPSKTNNLYARSAFLDPDVESPSEDMEEILINAIVSGPDGADSKSAEENFAAESEKNNFRLNDMNSQRSHADVEFGSSRAPLLQPMKVD